MDTFAADSAPFPRRRLVWTVLFAASLGPALAIAPGAWQLWTLLVVPDLALFVEIGRALERGQLHPRAVPLYNTLHHPLGPVALAAASTALGPAWLAAALAWLAHVAVDRAAAYGPRDARGFVTRGR
jgi:Domain of unknown function (DUF4260)